MSTNRSRPITYQLRLPIALREWLKYNAKKNYRSLADEINMHLEQARESVKNDAGTKKADDTMTSNTSAFAKTVKGDKSQ